MIKAVIRIEETFNVNGTDYFGGVLTKQVTEITMLRDKDMRNEPLISPCGIKGIVKLKGIDGRDRIFDIEVNRWAFDFESKNEFVAIFSHMSLSYELYVKFYDKSSKIKKLEFSVFRGDECVETKKTEDFISFTNFI